MSKPYKPYAEDIIFIAMLLVALILGLIILNTPLPQHLQHDHQDTGTP